jgi:hypothetical protein
MNLRHKRHAIQEFAAHAKRSHRQLRGYSLQRIIRLAMSEVKPIGWHSSPQYYWDRIPGVRVDEYGWLVRWNGVGGFWVRA